MGALSPSNGVLTIVNTTDTFTAPGGLATGNPFQPQAASFYGSAASHLILVDADGVVVLEMATSGTAGIQALDAHYFVAMRPWKTPIHATTLTAGGKLRIYV